MKPTKQVRIMIVACLASAVVNLIFCIVAVRNLLRPVEYTIQYTEPQDLSFLDFVTNRPLSVATVITNNVPTTETVSELSNPQLPIVFDSYTVANGVSYAGYKGHYIRAGDFVLGQLCEDVTPWLVKIGGNLYPITQREGIKNERVPENGDSLR